jgi:hypothetical protein
MASNGHPRLDLNYRSWEVAFFLVRPACEKLGGAQNLADTQISSFGWVTTEARSLELMNVGSIFSLSRIDFSLKESS